MRGNELAFVEIAWAFLAGDFVLRGLKSAVTAIGPENLLVNPELIDAESFCDFQVLIVDSSEPAAANAVLVEDHLVVSTSFPKTNARLAEMGFDCRPVDSGELAKAEGGLTCCSILFKG